MERDTKLYAALALAASLVACGPGPKPSTLIDFERSRGDEYAQVVQQRFAELWKESETHYRNALDAHDDGEPEETAHHTVLADITWRTAVLLSQKRDADDSTKAAANRLRIAAEDLTANRKRKEIAEDAVARMIRMQDLQKQMAAAKAKIEEQKKSAVARQKVDDVLIRLKEAEAIDAGRHAPGELNKAQAGFQMATDALAAGRYRDAERLADAALADANAVIVVAQPKFDAEQKQRAIDARVKALFTAAAGVPDSEPRIAQRGVVLTVRGLFESSKTVVSDDRTYALSLVADLSKKFPEFPVIVEGHTDNRGRREKNLVLSQGRAQAVSSYLSGAGIDPGRLQSIGRGDEMPVSDNSNRDGRAQNRRVDIVFLRPQVN